MESIILLEIWEMNGFAGLEGGREVFCDPDTCLNERKLNPTPQISASLTNEEKSILC